MSYTFQDAEYEQGMDELFLEFKQQYEDDFIFDKVFDFYKLNPELAVDALLNLSEAELLLKSEHYTASFLHAFIAIESGVKVVILKPILSSLSLDHRATDLLFKDTFKLKSIPYISEFYYQILFELTEINFKEIKRNGCSKTLWYEFKEMQQIRNKIIHQGQLITEEMAESEISIAIFLFSEIIPTILKRYNFRLNENKIVYG